MAISKESKYKAGGKRGTNTLFLPCFGGEPKADPKRTYDRKNDGMYGEVEKRQTTTRIRPHRNNEFPFS